jgi:hypothetical protein
MRSIAMLGALAVFAAAPLSAQGNIRTGGIDPARRVPSTGGVLGTILGGRDTIVQSRSGKRSSDRIPPGHLPPAGMCRIWIDGVPPGQQPAPTDCQTAVATKPANARVIWGDQTAFPGKGKGKFKQGKGDKGRDIDDDRDDDDSRDLKRGVSRGKNDKIRGHGRSDSKRSKKG